MVEGLHQWRGYQKRAENQPGFQTGSQLEYLRVSPRVMLFLKPIQRTLWAENWPFETLPLFFFKNKLIPCPGIENQQGLGVSRCNVSSW